MADDFLRIAITPPGIFEGETKIITSLLNNGDANLVHLRHPDATEAQLAHLLQQLPEHILPHITLHDHFELATEFNIGGIHLNRRNPNVPSLLQADSNRLRKSASCHSINEIETYAKKEERLTYVTLSPIFNSISKQGYKAAFSMQELEDIIPLLSIRVVALGGITPDKFPLLRSVGFKGAAMLGHYFKPLK